MCPVASASRPKYLIFLTVIAGVLSLAPVLLIPIPGFADAPSHMARHHILAMVPDGGALARIYAVQWHWIANLGEDIPAALLGRWLGGEQATRIVTALIAPLTIAGIVTLSRAAHGRIAASAMLALPLVLHQAWMFGFLNYCLGIALALLTAAWLFARQRVTWAGQLGLMVAGLVVWTAHLASWAVLLVLAGANGLVTLRSWRDLRRAIWSHGPLLVPLLPLLIWRAQASGSDFAFYYEEFVQRKVTVFAGALRGSWMAVDIALLLAILLAALPALRWAGKRQVEPRLLISGLVLAGCALAAPEYLMNSWGTDLRTAPIALLLLVLAIRPAEEPRRERTIALIGAALFLVRLGSVTWDWASRSPELEQRLAMLDAVPRAGRLGYLHVNPSCDGWKLTPDEKLASYAVERREAFVNTLFMVDNARLVTIRDPHLQARWTSDSQRVRRECPADRVDLADLRRSLNDLQGDRFDAIWVSGVPRADLPPLPGYAVARSLPGETMLVRR